MSYKVLIVDDSKLARMAVGRILRTLYPDWMCADAANADEAVSMVRSTEIDIILLDYNMPGRDGLALAAELRQLYPSMPIALVSANNQTEIVNQAGQVGAVFLGKPLTQPILATFLSDAVKQLEVSHH